MTGDLGVGVDEIPEQRGRPSELGNAQAEGREVGAAGSPEGRSWVMGWA